MKHTQRTYLMLLAAYMLCTANGAMAKGVKSKTKKTIFHGNTFTLAYNPDAGSPSAPVLTYSLIAEDREPVKMNSEKIYTEEELDREEWATGYVNDSEVEPLLLGRLNDVWQRLPDGDYYLDVRNLVADKKGRLCYYNYNGLTGTVADTINQYPNRYNFLSVTNIGLTEYVTIPPALLDSLEKKIARVFRNAHVMVPGKVNGRPVPYMHDGFLGNWCVRVMNHTVETIYCKYCPVFVCGFALCSSNTLLAPVQQDSVKITDTTRKEAK